MATNGIIAYGTTLAGASTGSIVEVVSVQGGGRATNFATYLSCSSSDSAAEKKPTTIDEGEYTFEIIYGPTDATGTYDLLNTSYQAKTVENWTVTFPSGGSWVCSGFISNLGQPSFGGPDDPITVSLTITFSGKATFAGQA